MAVRLHAILGAVLLASTMSLAGPALAQAGSGGGGVGIAAPGGGPAGFGASAGTAPGTPGIAAPATPGLTLPAPTAPTSPGLATQGIDPGIGTAGVTTPGFENQGVTPGIATPGLTAPGIAATPIAPATPGAASGTPALTNPGAVGPGTADGPPAGTTGLQAAPAGNGQQNAAGTGSAVFGLDLGNTSTPAKGLSGTRRARVNSRERTITNELNRASLQASQNGASRPNVSAALSR